MTELALLHCVVLAGEVEMDGFRAAARGLEAARAQLREAPAIAADHECPQVGPVLLIRAADHLLAATFDELWQISRGLAG